VCYYCRFYCRVGFAFVAVLSVKAVDCTKLDYGSHKAKRNGNDTFYEKLSNYCYILAVKQSEKPMNGMHVCGQAIVETSMYYSEKTTTGTIGTVQYSKSYGKKTTTGTVGIVRYSKRSKVQ